MTRFQCIIESCDCDAYFGYEAQKIPYYCFVHKEHDMTQQFNIEEESVQKILDCGNVILPLFKIDAVKPKKHTKNEKSEKSEKKCCITNGCLKIARYNYIQNSEPLFCISHRRSKMINLLPSGRKKSNWVMLNNFINKLLIKDENYSMIKSALLQNDLKT